MQMREDYWELERQYNLLDEDYEVLHDNHKTLGEEFDELISKNYDLQVTIDLLEEEQKPRVLEHYLIEKKYKVIDKIAYKQKRSFQGKQYSIYLNELITPNAWEVENFRRKLRLKGDLMDDAWIIGNALAKHLTWTDDGNLANTGDYYVMPNETLVHRKVDCEDHAFALTSIDTRFGVAYGFHKATGHAFNCFVYNGKLYILDTVDNKAFIKKYDDQSDYKIHFIITRDYTFQLKGGVQFGYLANWH